MSEGVVSDAGGACAKASKEFRDIGGGMGHVASDVNVVGNSSIEKPIISDSMDRRGAGRSSKYWVSGAGSNVLVVVLVYVENSIDVDGDGAVATLEVVESKDL